jgi:excisionase family DNA binding protein
VQTAVGGSRSELQRLVDSLPEQDAITVRQFIEYLVVQRTRGGGQEEQKYTLPEVAPILRLSVRSLRRLVREGVIPARKDGRRWAIEARDVEQLLTPEAREFLSQPLERADFTDQEKTYSQIAWQEYLAAQTRPLTEVLREQDHESDKP